MTLQVTTRHRQGDFRLDVSFETSGGLTALFGPSGSGKSTVINIIAGLVRPDGGRITLDGETLLDSDKRIFRKIHHRRIGCVFQDARLFPHLTVTQNLRYGGFFAPTTATRAGFDAIVELLGIGHLLARRPSSLSGGEKQRVAIGRALLSDPKLLLMDEPLASLDDSRKAEIMPHVLRLRDESRIPIVYVSHSVAEVAQLATDVVVLANGKVVANGPAGDVLARLDVMPASERAEAGSLMDLEIAGHDDHFDLTVLRSRGGTWRVPRFDGAVGTRVRARIRARDVMIATERPTAISALNVLDGTIAGLRDIGGPDVLITIDSGGDQLVAQVTRRSVEALGLHLGKPVHAVVKAVTMGRTSLVASAQ